jgi:Protein of unknown function (DUF4235)
MVTIRCNSTGEGNFHSSHRPLPTSPASREFDRLFGITRHENVHRGAGSVLGSGRSAVSPRNTVTAAASGLIARTVLTGGWHAITGRDHKPQPGEEAANTFRVVVAAMTEGARFASVRALMDRIAAAGISRATGSWPIPDQEESGD